MKLVELYPELRDEELGIIERKQELAMKIKNTEFSVAGSFEVDDLGTYAVRLFVFPKESENVKILASELGSLLKVNWKLEFDETVGKFYYKAKKEKHYDNDQHLLLFVRNVPTPPNCKIIEKTKEVKYFEKVCNQK